MKKFILASLVISLVVLTGCASIIHGSKQAVSVTASPKGSNIKITGPYGNKVFYEGTDSIFIKLNRAESFFKKGEYKIVVEKSGYDTVEIPINGELNVGSYVVGNLFFGGWLGWVVVDPLTGGMWTLKTMEGMKPEGLSIVLKENVSDADMSNGTKVQ